MRNVRLSWRCWRGFLDCFFFPLSWRHRDPSKRREPLIRNRVTSQKSWILASSPVWVLFHNVVNCQGDRYSVDDRMWNEYGALEVWYTDRGKHRYSNKNLLKWQNKSQIPNELTWDQIQTSELRGGPVHSGTATFCVREYRNLSIIWNFFTNKRKNQLTVRLPCT